jgi:hypothetical protein
MAPNATSDLYRTTPPMNGESNEAAPPVMYASHKAVPPAMGSSNGLNLQRRANFMGQGLGSSNEW